MGTAGGAGGAQQTDNETLTKFEIMDGAPVKDQCIPVRLYMNGFDLTPTYKNVQNKFSVKYFLNLVLVDEEDRRYFKQQEIFIWRKKIADVEGCYLTCTVLFVLCLSWEAREQGFPRFFLTRIEFAMVVPCTFKLASAACMYFDNSFCIYIFYKQMYAICFHHVY